MRVSWTPLGRGTSHLIGSEQGESGPMPCSTRRPPSALPLPTHCEKAAEPRWNAQEWGPPARVREPGSVTAGEFAGESAVEVGTRVVQADDLHVLATLGVLRPDGVQRGDGGGVPDVGGGQVDDDLVGVACVVEPADEVVGGGEEQLAGDGVDDAGDDRERDRSGISASATTRPASTSVRQTFGSVSQSGRRPRSREAWDRAEKAREQVPVVSRAPPLVGRGVRERRGRAGSGAPRAARGGGPEVFGEVNGRGRPTRWLVSGERSHGGQAAAPGTTVTRTLSPARIRSAVGASSAASAPSSRPPPNASPICANSWDAPRNSPPPCAPAWTSVKATYHLTANPAEAEVLSRMLDTRNT